MFAQGLLSAKSRNRHVGASPVPSCVAAPVSPLTLERSLQVEQSHGVELRALFLATRAEFWSPVCQHFLSVISSLAGLTPGALAATWATWELLLLRFHDPCPLHVKFPNLLRDLLKTKEKKPTQT